MVLLRDHIGKALPAIVGMLLLLLTPAFAERRVALVIGNSKYSNVPPLANPRRDAEAIADMFLKANFDVVTVKSDLAILEFRREVRRFFDTVRTADIAVVYYAGHGIEINGTNYMLPVDARLASDIDAEDEAVDLDRIVRTLEPARLLRLVLIDACRDNPFYQRVQRTRAATRAVGTGLAKVEPTSPNTLIAYAAKAGKGDQEFYHLPWR